MLNPKSEAVKKIQQARHHDPFEVLGLHSDAIRAFVPHAIAAWVHTAEAEFPMQRIGQTDLFEWQASQKLLPGQYKFRVRGSDGAEWFRADPYCYAPQLNESDLWLFCEGANRFAYRMLGAHVWAVQGVAGVLFSVWAPNAERVSVVGGFNHWDGRCHPMRSRGSSGVWELFIPELGEGSIYKFEIRNRDSGDVFLKSDPFAQFNELRPSTASVVAPVSQHQWSDAAWLEERAHYWLNKPVSIYEVHLGSWRRDDSNWFLNYRQLAHELVDYVKKLGFTHVQLMPVAEHPFDGSWGYQVTGYFAPTSRYGTPDDFRYFVDYMHQHGIGVLLDWVPGHFPKDAHGLARFDGSALFEHEHPFRGEHMDWGTYIFNYGRPEVKGFLISNAIYWMNEFHIDGLRVDAVASMLYLNYSRKEGEWIPNQFGGVENLEAVAFLRDMNAAVHEYFPGVWVIAEESTSWPMVSRPVYLGGLGFSMKWNMGWMNDTLYYFERDTIHRKYHHDKLTFSLMYAFSENFVLPLSHDEVVHGKKSILHKMPGDEWQQFANVRLLYTYMFTHPGKKLLFMGAEFAQRQEWQVDHGLEWPALSYFPHEGVLRAVTDLNQLYRSISALHFHDFEASGFEWIDCHDSDQSVLSYLRKHGNEFVVVVLNFTPVLRESYRIGVPAAGHYLEVFNSDSIHYGGTNQGNSGGIDSENKPFMSHPQSISLRLPPLAGVVLRLQV